MRCVLCLSVLSNCAVEHFNMTHVFIFQGSGSAFFFKFLTEKIVFVSRVVICGIDYIYMPPCVN